jgi:galactokinase
MKHAGAGDLRRDEILARCPGADADLLLAHRFDLARFVALQREVRAGVIDAASSLYRGVVEAPRPGDVGSLPPRTSDEGRALVARGEDAIARGELAIVVLAGGMATRFRDRQGAPCVKAMVPIDGEESFIDVKLAQARRAGDVPVCVMGSFATLPNALAPYLRSVEYVRCFAQSITVRLLADGSVFGARAGHALPLESYATPGHGDFFDAIRATGVLQDLLARGASTILMSNVDNLGASIDPLLFGAFLARRDHGIAMMAETVERRPEDGASVGVVARADGQLRILEGLRIPTATDTAELVDASINTFWLDARRLDREIALDVHAVHKRVGDEIVIQGETIACEASGARDEHGEPVLPFAAIRVPREGPIGRFWEGRFYPVKDRSDLARVRLLLRASDTSKPASDQCARLEAAFATEFPASDLARARLFFAPGRINLIGEHTDYNEGLALPAAIDRGILALAAPRDDGEVAIVSLTAGETVRFRIVDQSAGSGFGRYARAVIDALRERGVVCSGMDAVLTSDLPQGGGMSSSAALCLVLARAIAAFERVTFEPSELASIAQRAEHRSGVACGIMDQWAIAHGIRDHASFLDCRAGASVPVPLVLGAHVFLVTDTAKPRGLVETEYNQRRAECEAATRALSRSTGRALRSLRDVTPEDLLRHGAELDARIRGRAEHVVRENERVEQSVRALSEGDLAAFGVLLSASHASLRDRFEVSCRELDVLVQLLAEHPGVLGARMMGGGFGGCTLSLVKSDDLSSIIADVGRAYTSATGLTPSFHAVRIGSGLRELAR